MFLGEQDGPGQAGHRDPLTGAPRAQGLVRDLDVVLGFGQKPFAEMAIDLMTTLMQFIGWQPLQVTGAFGGKKFLREPFRQFFRMVLDELDKTKCNHGIPPALSTSILRPRARGSGACQLLGRGKQMPFLDTRLIRMASRASSTVVCAKSESNSGSLETIGAHPQPSTVRRVAPGMRHDT